MRTSLSQKSEMFLVPNTSNRQKLILLKFIFKKVAATVY